MNTSFLYKPQNGAGVIAVLAVIVAVLAMLDAPLPWLVGIVVLIVVIAGWVAYRGWLTGKVMMAILKRAREVRAGEFEERVVFLGLRGNLRSLVDEFNGVLDMTDAYLREAMLAMKAAGKGKYYRKIRLESLRGSYRGSATGINAAIDEMAGRRTMDEFAVDGINKLVANAQNGQLDARVNADRYSGAYLELANGMNSLMSTVQKGLTESGAVLSALADANLTMRVSGDFRGAFAKLRDDTNLVADTLVQIVGQLRQTSGGVKTATGEILAGANDLAERTTQQAATIEETSAAIEQLSSTVSENAKRAGSARDQALNASKTAEEGGEAVRAANGAMERIANSSAKISNIIGMIDDIAFQTNLLALNASVEAARAGEAGKGFAVVAVEVRRLAQSAAEASSEVKTLIEQSGYEVIEGSKLVSIAAEKLTAMLDAVRTNAAQMESIAKDSKEQANAIEEVTIAVRQMDEMTQHNAALVEETNAAIEQTEGQASRLDQIIGLFRLGGADGKAGGKAKAVVPMSRVNANVALSIDSDWDEF